MRIILAAVLVVSSAAIAVSAQQSSREPQQKQDVVQMLTVTGELVDVNTDANVIRVRKQDNSEMNFSYSPETEIVGADKAVSGLATLKGSEVTVHYTLHGKTNAAAKIEITPKKG